MLNSKGDTEKLYEHGVDKQSAERREMGGREDRERGGEEADGEGDGKFFFDRQHWSFDALNVCIFIQNIFRLPDDEFLFRSTSARLGSTGAYVRSTVAGGTADGEQIRSSAPMIAVDRNREHGHAKSDW